MSNENVEPPASFDRIWVHLYMFFLCHFTKRNNFCEILIVSMDDIALQNRDSL